MFLDLHHLPLQLSHRMATSAPMYAFHFLCGSRNTCEVPTKCICELDALRYMKAWSKMCRNNYKNKYKACNTKREIQTKDDECSDEKEKYPAQEIHDSFVKEAAEPAGT